MKIVLAVNTSWNVYNFRMNLVRTLIANGHEVHTVAPEDDFTNLVRETGCIHHNIYMDSQGTNPVKDSALMAELYLLYRKIRPDVILHYTIKPNIYGTLAAALLKIPVINTVCGLGTAFLKDNLISAIAVFLYKISFCFAHKVFFQNPEDLKLFVDKKIVRPEAAELVPGSGIDLKKFQPVPFRRNSVFTFLMISRLIKDKGVFEYIDAARILQHAGFQVRFQLLGSPDPKHKRGIKIKEIRDWIVTNTVVYLGSTDDVRKYIEDADCVVLPSYREGTPRTLLEAASSSKPIITTDVPGCNQVVTNQYNGLLCKPKDPVDLATKMRQMASFRVEKLDSLGRNGRIKVQAEYDESLVIKKYAQALQEIENTSATINQETEKSKYHLGKVLWGLATTNVFLIHPKNVRKLKLRLNRFPIWSKNDIRKRLNINPKNILHYGLIRR